MPVRWQLAPLPKISCDSCVRKLVHPWDRDGLIRCRKIQVSVKEGSTMKMVRRYGPAVVAGILATARAFAALASTMVRCTRAIAVTQRIRIQKPKPRAFACQ